MDLSEFFWKQWEGKNIHRNIALLSRIKLNGKEKSIRKALIDSDISHEEFTLVINVEPNYLRLKRKKKRKRESQLGGIEIDILIECGKRIWIDKILNQNEIRSLKLKTKV